MARQFLRPKLDVFHITRLTAPKVMRFFFCFIFFHIFSIGIYERQTSRTLSYPSKQPNLPSFSRSRSTAASQTQACGTVDSHGTSISADGKKHI